MTEVPEEAIEVAEVVSRPAAHGHDAVTAEDGTLGAHLREDHALDAPPTLSPTTQQGLHDRLHDRSKAADD